MNYFKKLFFFNNGSEAPVQNIIFFHKRLIVVGGAERLLIGQANALVDMNLAVTVVGYHFSQELKGRFSRSVEVVGLGGPECPNRRSDALCFFRFFRFCWQKRAKYLVTGSGLLEVMVVAKLLPIKYAVELHHPTSMLGEDSCRSSRRIKKILDENLSHATSANKHNRGPAPQHMTRILSSLRYEIQAALQLAVLNSADTIFVLSKFAQEDARLCWGVDSSPVSSGIALSYVKQVQAYVAQDGPIENGKIIVSISRLSPEKNLANLIHGFRKSGLVALGYSLHIYGTGPDYDSLMNLIVELRMGDAIVLRGYLPDDQVGPVLLQSDIFVNLQGADFNLTVMEALTTDIKVITSNLGVIESDAAMGRAITYVDVTSTSAVAQALRESSETAHSRHPAAAAGLMYRKHGWHVRANSIVAALERTVRIRSLA